MEANPKTIVDFFEKNHFGSGIYFWSGFFVYILTILILTLENNWIFSSSLCFGILLFGIIQKSRYFILLASIPLLVSSQLFYIEKEILTTTKEIQSLSENKKGKLVGEIQSISGVKNGNIRVIITDDSNRNIQVQLPVQKNIAYGDFLSINPENFEPLTEYLISRGVEATIKTSRGEVIENPKKSWIKDYKNSFLFSLKKIYPQPEQGLIAGILLGDPSLMKEETSNIFRNIGLSHITVVSGSNISFLLTSILLVLFFLPKKIKLTTAIFGILLYIFLVGSDPPVLRAGIMGIIGAIALLYPGKIDSLRILAVTGTVLLFFSPYSLVYDPGFQLSFLATCGIITVGKIFPKISQLRQGILISVFACFWTLPITIGIFGNFHTWSIIANILAGPLVGISMTLAIIGGILGTFWSFGGYWISFFSFVCLNWITTIAYFFAPLPYKWDFSETLQLIIGFISFGLISGITYRYQYLQKQ